MSFTLAAACAVAGCRREAGFTHDDARALISASDAFARAQPEITVPFETGVEFAAMLDRGAADGLWVLHKDLVDRRIQSLTPAGEKMLSKATNTSLFEKNLSITLTPVTRREIVKIVRMSDGDGHTREVQFQWKYARVPVVLTRIGLQLPESEQNATAQLRHFDDGWHVDAIQLAPLHR